MSKPSAMVSLWRTFAAVSLVTLLLVIALVWPRPELKPVRSTSVELDEPSGPAPAEQTRP